MKQVFYFITVLLLFSVCKPEQQEFYPELFSTKAVEKAKKLENRHPSGFFEAASDYYEQGKINDAALLFYIGQLRYRYYLAAKPDLEPGGEEALFASLRSALGSEINYKLGQNDVDTYIEILDAVIEWGKKRDYDYYPKKHNPEKYEKTLQGLKELRSHVTNNKDKFNKNKDPMP